MGDQTKNANFLFSGRVRFRRVKSPLLVGPLSLDWLLTAWAWNAMEGSPFKIPKTAQNQFISIIFSIFPRIKFCGPHYHTHTTSPSLPLSLSPSLLLPPTSPPPSPLCAIKWGIRATLKDDQILSYLATSSRDNTLHYTEHACSSCWKYRYRTLRKPLLFIHTIL